MLLAALAGVFALVRATVEARAFGDWRVVRSLTDVLDGSERS